MATDPVTGISSQLLESACGGCSAAVALLIGIATPIARRIVLTERRSVSRRGNIDWEGLSQEVMLRVLRGLPTFNGRQEGVFVAWLARIARRVVLDACRRLPPARTSASTSIDEESDLRSIPSQDPGPSERAETADAVGRVRSAMVRLPSQWRQILESRFTSKGSLAAVARDMNLPGANAARCMLSRAVEGLRSEWCRIRSGASWGENNSATASRG